MNTDKTTVNQCGLHKGNWGISLKNPAWGDWKQMVRMYGVTFNHAECEAKRAARYYEGSTEWKVEPIPNLTSPANSTIAEQ